jgi:holo-[acyl-carrier protein] synthase
MMIIGIGSDLIEVERIRHAVCRHSRFLTRNFTELEIAFFETRQMNPYPIATNFALKEAVSKALGTGFRGFNLVDIEILRDSNGKPYVNLYKGAAVRLEQLTGRVIHVTASHDKRQVMAYCVIEGEQI